MAKRIVLEQTIWNANLDDASTFLRVYSASTVPSVAAVPRAELRHSHLLCTSVLAACLAAFALAVAGGIEVPLWFQPTSVGFFWAGVFLTGFAVGSVGRGRLLTVALTLLFVVTTNIALQRITDLGANACLLVAACLVTTGWLAARVNPVWQKPSDSGQRKPWRVSIWDLGFMTLLVACFCHAIPNLATNPMLLVGVLIALVACLMVSWIAARWALTDCWSAWTLAALAVVGMAFAAWVVNLSPDNTTLMHLLRWAVIGPVNVIVTQGTVVLLMLALGRWELRAASIEPIR